MFSPLKCALSTLIVLLTGGLFLILLTWRSDIKLNCLYRKVPLPYAKKILLKVSLIFSRSFFRGQNECLYLQDKFHQIFEEDVLQEDIRVLRTDEQGKESEERQRNFHFVNKKIKYVWDPNQDVSALAFSIFGICHTFLLSELP